MDNLLKIVVAGEVDCGKSTMIGRLLFDMGSLPCGAVKEIEETCRKSKAGFEFAYLLDSFKEERDGCMTIDTTQVFCKNRSGREFVFIDVPGHQELLKNMLCGSSYADIAVLVLDVNKSVEQQTRRHAFVLKFLGIEDVILVLNKMDTVNFDETVFSKVKTQAGSFLKGLSINYRHCIPVSAKNGDNLVLRSENTPWYGGPVFLDTLSKYSGSKAAAGFCLPVQDIYVFDGKITLAGRIIYGKIRMGEKVSCLPSGKECRVRQIKVFNKQRFSARAPENVGLSLSEANDIKRGEIICKQHENILAVKTEFTSRIICTNNFDLSKFQGLTLECSTQKVNAIIKQVNTIWDSASLQVKPNRQALETADAAEVEILLDKPLAVGKSASCVELARFVLKDNHLIYAIGMII